MQGSSPSAHPTFGRGVKGFQHQVFLDSGRHSRKGLSVQLGRACPVVPWGEQLSVHKCPSCLVAMCFS